jgi:DNA-directed RNA polymerase specialized sigma24 family protein
MFLKHKKDLARRATRVLRTNTGTTVEDVLSKAALAVMRNIDENSTDNYIVFLLRKAVVTNAIDLMRSGKRYVDEPHMLGVVSRVQRYTQNWQDMYRTNGITETLPCRRSYYEIEEAELRVMLDAIGQTLPEGYYHVLLCDLARLSNKEGADECDLTVDAYKSKLYRARKKVREQLHLEPSAEDLYGTIWEKIGT